ncbi:MAG: ATP-binding protein [Methylococcaceae bacterium]
MEINKTTTKKRSVTLVTYALCGLAIIAILILTSVNAIKMDQLLQDELRVRVTDVVSILAKNVIDGDLHSQVRTLADKRSAAFSKIKNDLVEVRQRSTSIANIYTMRRLNDGTVIFVVDGSEKDQNEIGDVYPQKSVTKVLTDAFNATPETATIYTETEIYTDDWGMWLSAYAPIFTSSGKLDGIIGIDISAEIIHAHELEHRKVFFIVGFAVMLMTLLFVLWLMRFIAKVNSELEQANAKLALQNAEKEKRADELLIANDELAFENAEKEKRADELLIANDELAFQNAEKEKRAAELADFHTKNDLLNSQLNHLQKLESIGRMTAGMAHEFNNILGCILGYNEMNQYVSDDMTDEKLKAELDNNTEQVSLAVKRAADLINQMLTYCRQDDASNAKIDVQPTHALIEEVLIRLRPTLPRRIKIETAFESDEIIEIDALDLQQILTNLVLNARDAMKEHGGILTISLRTVTNIKDECVTCASVIDGDFIQLSIADNGTGIEPTIISRIFDPFFTTKSQGEGAGLGLSVVVGLVAKSGGHILVESNQSKFNHGTEFKLLFPMPTTNFLLA